MAFVLVGGNCAAICARYCYHRRPRIAGGTGFVLFNVLLLFFFYCFFFKIIFKFKNFDYLWQRL